MSDVRDLRHAGAEEFWKAFEEVMAGEDGLMTYRYLGTRAEQVGDAWESTMRIRRDLRNPAGGLLAAPLSIALADLRGVEGDAVSVPAPVMTSVHLVDPGLDVEAVRVRIDRPGHAGRTLSFNGSAVVVDAARPDRLLAVTDGLGVRLASVPAGAEGGYRYVDPGPGVPDSPDLPPLAEAFGARRTASGFELPVLSGRIASTSASLHHGPTQIVLEAAALALAAEAAGTDRLQIEEWTVMYRSAGRVGPFTTTGSVVGGPLGRFLARMELADEGNGGRLVATALAAYRPFVGD
ncbi:MAG TPA: hypothetical protein VKV36_11635 [Acidimicrobiales bacterium]|nr:hypothetical protein [Acidimicrobiales bacterium]